MSSKHVLSVALAVGLLLPGCSKQNDEPSTVTNDQPETNGLYLSWQHPASRRYAMLEVVSGTIWLYLTVPGEKKLERACPVYVTVPPADTIDWNLVQKTGQPPPITKDVASPTALLEHPVASEFTILWSDDGSSVGLVRSNQIICMIVAGFELGHSRALSKKSALGLPFDETLALRTFPNFHQP